MFICVCGIAGSGKSTLAEFLAKKYDIVIVSTDKIREELFGDASIQENPKKVFEIAYKRIAENLYKNSKVIFDATNLLPKDRKRILNFAKERTHGPFYCYYSTVSKETAIKRNSERDRKVPIEVIERQFNKFVIPTLEEGWDRVIPFN